MSRYTAPHPLFGCQLKLDRAYDHIETLNQAAQRFLRRYPHETVLEPNFQAPEYRAWIKVRDTPPHELSTIIGDAVHNLRSTLDHLVYQLAVANDKSPSGTLYPAFVGDPLDPGTDKRTRDRWKSLSKLIHPDDLAKIEVTQPYRGRNLGNRHPLSMLNELSNRDKHREIHLSASVLMNSRFGFEAVRDVELGDTKFGHQGPFEHGTVVAVCPCRFTGPKPKVNMKAQLIFGVAFADGGPPGIAGRETVEELTRLANSVHDIVLDLGLSPRFDHENS